MQPRLQPPRAHAGRAAARGRLRHPGRDQPPLRLRRLRPRRGLRPPRLPPGPQGHRRGRPRHRRSSTASATGRSSCSSTSTTRTGTTTRPRRTRGCSSRPYAGTLTGLLAGLLEARPREHERRPTSQHLLALYDGEIRYTDDELGRVLDHLKARGLDREHAGGRDLRPRRGVPGARLVGAPEDAVRGGRPHPAGRARARRRAAARAGARRACSTWRRRSWPGRACPLPPTQQGRSLLAPPGEREAYGETDHRSTARASCSCAPAQGGGKAILSLDRGRTAPRRGMVRPGVGPGRARLGSSRRVRDRPNQGLPAGPLAFRPPPGPGRPGRSTCPPEQIEQLRALGYIQ